MGEILSVPDLPGLSNSTLDPSRQFATIEASPGFRYSLQMKLRFLSTSLACLALFSLPPAKASPVERGKPSPPRAVKSFIEEFSVRDLDGNGRLSREEFAGGGQPSDNRLFQRMDLNRNRSVSLLEFAEHRGVNLPRGTRPFIDEAKKDFRNLDANRNGQVTIEEVAAVTTFTDGNALEEYFSKLDSDSTGGISLEEWRAGNDYPNQGKPTVFGRYLGLTLGAAERIAQSEGRSSRVVRIDGEWKPVTMDYQPDRLNFSINGGLVTKVTTG